MELSDIWLKIANNARLTPQEQDFLKMQGRETQMRNAFIAGNTTAGGQLNVPMPFFPIFSETFATNRASVAVEIPTGYKHLLLFGTGRHTSGVGSAAELKCVINGDTGSNYKYQNISATSTTVNAAGGTAAYFAIGSLTESGATAGEQSSFYAFLNGYTSPLFKTCTSLISTVSASALYISAFTTRWTSTAVVNKLEFSSALGNIAAGSTLSVYGVF